MAAANTLIQWRSDGQLSCFVLKSNCKYSHHPFLSWVDSAHSSLILFDSKTFNCAKIKLALNSIKLYFCVSQPNQMARLWRGFLPENRPGALWEQTHFHCVRCIHKCGKPCVAVAPSSREREEGVWPGHVQPRAGSCGSSGEGNWETWAPSPHTDRQQTDTQTDGEEIRRKINPPGE